MQSLTGTLIRKIPMERLSLFLPALTLMYPYRVLAIRVHNIVVASYPLQKGVLWYPSDG